jgi:hypothetical protein
VGDGDASLPHKMLVRELTPAEARDPRSRHRVEFWSLVHRLELSSDVRLGIWGDGPPTEQAMPVSSSPLAVFGWQGLSGPLWMPLSIDSVRRCRSILGTGTPADVVLARRSLPKAILAALRERYGYRPEVEGQQDGWWFLDGRRVPKTAPTFRSTVSLLPEITGARTRAIRDSAECLALVDVDDWWAVLSEAAILVYEVGAALHERRVVRFAQWSNDRRVVWNVEPVDPIAFSQVRRRFGKEAADRARSDVKSVVVRCSRAV